MVRYVKVCPRCRSIDVETNLDNPALVATGSFLNSYRCNSCGYVGMMPEIPKDELLKSGDKGEDSK